MGRDRQEPDDNTGLHKNINTMLLDHRRESLTSVEIDFPEAVTTYLEGQASSSPSEKMVWTFGIEICKFLYDSGVLAAYETKTGNGTGEIHRGQIIKNLKKKSNLCSQHGTPTHDLETESRMLYRMSQQGAPQRFHVMLKSLNFLLKAEEKH